MASLITDLSADFGKLSSATPMQQQPIGSHDSSKDDEQQVRKLFVLIHVSILRSMNPFLSAECHYGFADPQLISRSQAGGKGNGKGHNRHATACFIRSLMQCCPCRAEKMI